MHHPLTIMVFYPYQLKGKAKNFLQRHHWNVPTLDQWKNWGPVNWSLLVHQGLGPARAPNAPYRCRRKHTVHCKIWCILDMLNILVWPWLYFSVAPAIFCCGPGCILVWPWLYLSVASAIFWCDPGSFLMQLWLYFGVALTLAWFGTVSILCGHSYILMWPWLYFGVALALFLCNPCSILVWPLLYFGVALALFWCGHSTIWCSLGSILVCPWHSPGPFILTEQTGTRKWIFSFHKTNNKDPCKICKVSHRWLLVIK